MPVDRIDKMDPGAYRVQEARDDRKRQEDQGQQEQEKDKFEKRPPLLKRILSWGSGPRAPTLLSKQPHGLRLPSSRIPQEEEEESLTLSQRVLVLWGILSPKGRPRIGVIIVYSLIVGMIVGATLLILGMTLWR